MIQPRNIDGIVRVMVVATVLFTAQSAAAATCESLSSLKLPDATITTAQSVAAGAFKPAGGGGRGGGNRFADLRPSARWPRPSSRPATPTSRSRSGCPPRAGTASSRQSATAAGTATSTRPPSPRRFAAATPPPAPTAARRRRRSWMQKGEALDYGHRAVHEMTVKAKALINELYGRRPSCRIQRLLRRRTSGAQGRPEVSRMTSTASWPARRR